MKYKTALIAFTLLCILLMLAQPAGGKAFRAAPEIADSQTDPRPEDRLVLQVYFPDFTSLNLLAAYLDIWEVNHQEG